MRSVMSTYMDRFRQERRTRIQLLTIVLALAVVVAGIVFWQLRYTGVAAVNEVYCGMEEHTHSEDCYAQVLTCGLEESDSEVLLLDTAEDGEAHVHDASCYESELICDLPEHVHTAACMSDETADVESAADWEATLPEELSGIWADDVVAVAESQLDYVESEHNFTLAEDGETHNGYTRYGAWYGNAYGDWDAMFASFVLHYAGVPEEDFPQASGAYAWLAELDQMESEDETGELHLYADASDYTPVVGDLVFLDTDGDGEADRVGIVTALEFEPEEEAEVVAELDAEIEELSEAEEEIAEPALLSLTVVEGDCEDAVRENEYAPDDEAIVGYGILPENPDAPEEEEIATLAWNGTASGQVVLNLGNGNGDHNFADYNGHDFGNKEAADEGTDLRYTTDSLADYADDDGKVTINLPSDNDLSSTFTVVDGVTVELGKELAYDYKLVGWVNIATGEYYDVSGGTVKADIDLDDENVFYADWIAESYDCHDSANDSLLRDDVVSTSSFVEIEMFDYNELFNLYSASVEQDGTSSETWSDSKSLHTTLLGGTEYTYTDENGDKKTVESFVFNNDGTTASGKGMLEIVDSRTTANTWTGTPNNTSKKYVIDSESTWGVTGPNATLFNLLFNKDNAENVVGVNYVGEADNLFWVDADGYYTYDSAESAAVYSQSEKRFYVYNEAQYVTGKTRACFLPYNSYTTGSSDNNAYYSVYNGSVDYWFGMKMDVSFYLPSATDSTGISKGNQVNGKDMVFNFSGDDDIWVFVDDTLVLDMSGIHDLSYGSIDFTTGAVTIGMSRDETTGVIDTTYGSTGNVNLSAGNHTLTVYYMERGGWESNLEIQFNVVPLWEYETGPVQTVTAEKTWVDAQGKKIAPEDLPEYYQETGVEVGLFDVLGAPDSETKGMKYTVETDGTYTFDYTDDAGLEHKFAYSLQNNTLIYTEVEDGEESTPVTFSDKDANDRLLDSGGNVVCWYEDDTGLLHVRMDVQTLSADNDWTYAWELLDAEGEYEVLELSGSSSYTTSSESEGLESYYYWSVVGDKEIEAGMLDGQHPVILTEAAQEAEEHLGSTQEALGWVIVGEAGGVKTAQVKFSQIATLEEISDNTSGAVQSYLGTYGVTSQSEIASLGDGALWYMVDSGNEESDVGSGTVEGFYLHCELNDVNYYLTLTDDEHGLTLTTQEQYESEFYYDSLGELMVVVSSGDPVRVEITGEGKINIDKAESTAADDDVRIYTLQATETSGFAFTAVNTFLPDLTVEKVDSTTEEPLAGVSFTLSYTDDGGNTYYYADLDENNEVKWSETEDVFKTGSDGIIVFRYLPDGTYTLTETEALNGYGALPDAITITIENGIVTGVKWTSGEEIDENLVAVSEDGLTITVANQPGGAELPNTGGVGTWMYTMAGLLLICGAAYLLYRNTRKERGLRRK